jgi:two-component system response regulator AtoC
VFDASAVEALHAHRWPGNVRELQHVLERAVLLCRGDAIVAADLGLEVPSRLANHAPGATAGVATLNLEQNERELIRRALDACQAMCRSRAPVGIEPQRPLSASAAIRDGM